MLTQLKSHHQKRRNEILSRLEEFKKNRTASDKKFLEEMAFCVFAANSSAKMGLKAAELLKDTLEKGTLEDYKKAVYKKVRFYNKRAEYLHHNKEKLFALKREFKKDISAVINGLEHNQRRLFIKEHFKGFGMKESSHLLRNLGHAGYCIIDKHILNTLKDIDVIKSNAAPKNEKEYLKIEKKLKEFAKQHKIDIDELDLAIWSFKTGEIIK
jgi:N-glycosylase/DNA lyase